MSASLWLRTWNDSCGLRTTRAGAERLVRASDKFCGRLVCAVARPVRLSQKSCGCCFASFRRMGSHSGEREVMPTAGKTVSEDQLISTIPTVQNGSKPSIQWLLGALSPSRGTA